MRRFDHSVMSLLRKCVSPDAGDVAPDIASRVAGAGVLASGALALRALAGHTAAMPESWPR